jgi:surfactin synthase thioesterase subunit
MIEGNHFFLHDRERELLTLLGRELSRLAPVESLGPAKTMWY